ncbi:hypothetical protein [Natribacillus halophilus]|uniref:Uncharacterized protein n=1 Tax=Natribacillus halophilus TaxID=549003 RepID=A0A1G8QWG6_9BACI|nr:hypothetical protein [Natribacillus halophilus]SDJ09048.1 hypothetical protein SAMN04488123_11450 [Natribacillus halophilus]
MLRKISFWYTLAFIIFWNGYTLHQYITGQPNVLQLFLFGIGFTVLLLATTWFSRWLMSHYKVVDEKAEEILSAKFKNKRSERNGRTVH